VDRRAGTGASTAGEKVRLRFIETGRVPIVNRQPLCPFPQSDPSHNESRAPKKREGLDNGFGPDLEFYRSTGPFARHGGG
jgi:hypothetical protein